MRYTDVVAVPPFYIAVDRAVRSGLAAAAILDVDGEPFALAGALDNDEARAIAAVVTRRLRAPDMLARMLAGEMLTTALDDREVAIGIASRCVFVVVILGGDAELSCAATAELRDEVEQMISRERAEFRSSPLREPGSGGSSSGPAELPLVELGVTVPRRDRN